MRIAVLGGGAAGTAAAWALRRAGADVTVFFGRPGASSLGSGALDLEPWELASRSAAVDPDTLAFAMAFDAWTLGTKECRVATYEGVLRRARGIDSALLDLEPLAGRTVGVAEAAIDGWDAHALSRSLEASRWASRTRTRFVPTRVDGIVEAGEGARSWFDVAALHDDPERAARLAACLTRTAAGVDAWLLGPWLGTAPGVAERLRTLVGKPCGETTSPPGGAAGARFDASRDALLASAGVHVRQTHADALQRRDARWLVLGRAGEDTLGDAGFDSVVLAVGGVVGGGVVLDGPDDRRGAGFRLSVRSPAVVGLDDRVAFQVSSVHGVDLTRLGMSALERVGVLADGAAVAGEPTLLVAGDCVLDRPRTVLEAVRSGIVAAKRATSRPGA